MTRELDSLLDEVRMNMEYDVYSRLHDEIMLMETDFEETLLLKQRNIELENRTCENCKHRMNKGKNAELCLYGDTREFMWIPKHIFNSGCNKMDRLKEI